MLSQRALLVIVKLVTPRVRVRVGVRVRVSLLFLSAKQAEGLRSESLFLVCSGGR